MPGELHQGRDTVILLDIYTPDTKKFLAHKELKKFMLNKSVF